MDTDNQTVDHLAHRLRFIGAKRARKVARRAVMFSETPLNGLVTMLDVIGLDPLFFFLRGIVSGKESPIFPIIGESERLLRNLSQSATLGVVTTRSQAAASTFLRQHDLAELFDIVITRESTQHLKPHPEPIEHAAAEVGLRPEQCAMVGDTPVDVLSARRAGAWAVGVLCGFGERYELERAGAHLIVPSTDDLLALFKAANKKHKELLSDTPNTEGAT